MLARPATFVSMLCATRRSHRAPRNGGLRLRIGRIGLTGAEGPFRRVIDIDEDRRVARTKAQPDSDHLRVPVGFPNSTMLPTGGQIAPAMRAIWRPGSRASTIKVSTSSCREGVSAGPSWCSLISVAPRPLAHGQTLQRVAVLCLSVPAPDRRATAGTIGHGDHRSIARPVRRRCRSSRESSPQRSPRRRVARRWSTP
jgi:hypothetical protein